MRMLRRMAGHKKKKMRNKKTKRREKINIGKQCRSGVIWGGEENDAMVEEDKQEGEDQGRIRKEK